MATIPGHMRVHDLELVIDVTARRSVRVAYLRNLVANNVSVSDAVGQDIATRWNAIEGMRTEDIAAMFRIARSDKHVEPAVRRVGEALAAAFLSTTRTATVTVTPPPQPEGPTS